MQNVDHVDDDNNCIDCRLKTVEVKDTLHITCYMLCKNAKD